jgi:alkaline phosphatase
MKHLCVTTSVLLGLAIVTGTIRNSFCVPREDPAPRNIILVIGDGMGPQQVGLAELYAAKAKDDSARTLSGFIRQSVIGAHMPSAQGTLVNDSACSATQIASACSCKSRQIGLNAEGAPCRTIFQDAKKEGKKLGLVSDTRITHATPAAFYAHVNDRDSENMVAEQLLDSGIDLALSGGRSFFLPKQGTCSSSDCREETGNYGERADRRNLLNDARKRGFSIALNARDLELAHGTPLLGLFSQDVMNDAFREGQNEQPTLAVMTQKALKLLDNPNGFILMVEAGQIDLAAHHNDAGWVLAELLRLSAALGVIDNFIQNRNDTLVVLTGDHETGGMGFSYYYPANVPLTSNFFVSPPTAVNSDFVSSENLAVLRGQKASLLSVMTTFTQQHQKQRTPKKLQQLIQSTAHLSLNTDVAAWIAGSVNEERHQPNMYDALLGPFYRKDSGPSAILGRALGAQLGIVWGTGTHTSTPIFVFSKGPRSTAFQGWFDTLELGQRLKHILEQKGTSPTM